MVDKIALNKFAFCMNSNTSEKLDSNINVNIIWISSDENVAKVDKEGTVTAIKEGFATITAKTKKNGVASCIVNVDFQVQNPILPSNWSVFIPDGEPHVWGDGNLYVYGSKDGVLKHFCSSDYHVIHTSNLINWTDAGVSYSTEDNDTVPYPNAIMWAPDCMYLNGKYYLYTWFEDGEYPDNPFVVTSDKPEGPFEKFTQLKTSGSNELLVGGDPGAFLDDDGKAYLYWGSPMAAQLSEDGTKVIESTMTNLHSQLPDFFEGVSMRKRDGIYYLIYAQNFGKRTPENISPTNLAYAMGSSPLGPFEYKGVIISNHGYQGAANIHGSIEKFKGQWYVFYHKPRNGIWNKRVACVEKIKFNDDGTIDQVEMTSSGCETGLLPNYKIDAEIACELSGNCRFAEQGSYNGIISSIKNGDYAVYKYINFGDGVTDFTANVTCSSNASQIEIRLDSFDGEIVGICDVPNDNSSGFVQVKCSVYKAKGIRAVYLVFTGCDDDNLFNIDWFKFDTL